MEFQLPSVLQEKLTPYDQVRRAKESEKKRVIRRQSKPFSLGLPPLEQLIPNDVLPKNFNREELIKRISLSDLNQRYINTQYPPNDKDGNPAYPNGKPLTFKKSDKLIHNSQGMRIQRRILLYHFEGMWTCLWIPHSNKYVYGYSFAYKETKANRSRFECEMYADGENRKVFCVPYHSRQLPEQNEFDLFSGYSWNDCERIKVDRSWWRYKTVYVTKQMIGQGHTYNLTNGIFHHRTIETWHDKSRYLKSELKDWGRCLASTIPHWISPESEKYGRSSDPSYSELFNRILPEQNTLGYVIKKNYEERQANWTHGHDADRRGYLCLKTTKKWDVESLKSLLFRLRNSVPLDLNERRHNIGHVLWKPDGWIEQPFFRKMLHKALESANKRLEESDNKSMHWVTSPIERVHHLIRWIDYVLDVWPDTPVDYFQSYEQYFYTLSVPPRMQDIGYYRYANTEEIVMEIASKKREYFGRMPVKTFLESMKKYSEQRAKEAEENTNYSSYDYETRMSRKVWDFREWTDTVNMLDSVIRSQYEVIARWDKLEPKPKLRKLDSPRRWRLTELHDHVMGMQWKENNENFNLPQDLFAKPIKVTWKEAFADDPIYQSTKGMENVDTGKSMWSEKEDSVMTFFQPITSHQLADWGRAVRNCVGNSSYANSIKQKRYFIVLAMVDQKPRFTIQLKLSDGTLLVDQIADIANKRLNDEERQFVEHGIGRALQLITTQLQPEEQNS